MQGPLANPPIATLKPCGSVQEHAASSAPSEANAVLHLQPSAAKLESGEKPPEGQRSEHRVSLPSPGIALRPGRQPHGVAATGRSSERESAADMASEQKGPTSFLLQSKTVSDLSSAAPVAARGVESLNDRGTKSSYSGAGVECRETRDTMSYTVSAMLPPPPGADSESVMTFVHYQLDCIGCEREVLGGLQLLGNGSLERLQGGECPRL